jgi:hypothetical protein
MIFAVRTKSFKKLKEIFADVKFLSDSECFVVHKLFDYYKKSKSNMHLFKSDIYNESTLQMTGCMEISDFLVLAEFEEDFVFSIQEKLKPFTIDAVTEYTKLVNDNLLNGVKQGFLFTKIASKSLPDGKTLVKRYKSELSQLVFNEAKLITNQATFYENIV